jgi:hypothetical protein
VPTDGPSLPDPKARTLARGPRKYRRKVASPKQWQAIIAAKGQHCRLCLTTHSTDRLHTQMHHVVGRGGSGLGDDVAENLVPLCERHHALVTARSPSASEQFCEALSDAEYAYAIQRGGEGYFERAYGVAYTR